MRKINSLKNFLTSALPYFIVALLGMVKISAFIECLGDEINALNQLFFQIFNYISLVEAGVGTLVTQKYYKLLIDDDKEAMIRVYSSSVRMLRKVSLAILGIGVIVSFFLEFLTNNSLSLGYMQLVFIVFLLRAVVEYLMLSPRFLLQADQRIYKINTWINFYRIVEYVVEIGWLYAGGNYIVILLSSIVIRVISYWYTNRKIFKEYPWLRYDREAEPVEIKGMGNVLIHKVAGTVYENTDILLISSFLTPITVTIYSSYNTIVKFINDLIVLLSSAITASFGNVMYKDEAEQRLRTFEAMNILFFFSAAIFVIALYYVTDFFVARIWLTEAYKMVHFGFVLMLILTFHRIARRPFLVLRDACAMFKQTQMNALLEAITNLVLSLVLVTKMGLVGVLLATVIATLVSNFWYFPVYMYRNVFQQSYWPYFVKYFIVSLYTVIACFLVKWLLPYPANAGFFGWFFMSALVCIAETLVSAAVFYALFPDFRAFIKKGVQMTQTMAGKLLKKVGNKG